MPFFRASIQDTLAYKGSFFMYSLGGILRVFIMMYLWKTVFANNPNSIIEGFTLAQMINYVFMSDVVGRTVYNGIDEIVAWEVKDGSIAMNLIRPGSYQWRLFFFALGNAASDFLFVGLPMWIGLVLVRHFGAGEALPSLANVAFFLLSFALSFLVMFFFNISFGFLAFYTTNAWGLTQTKWVLVQLLSGRLIPLAFFPVWAQKAFQFLPFASMTYSPVMIYLGMYTPLEILKILGIQIVWIVILYAVSVLVWKNAVKRLTILGG